MKNRAYYIIAFLFSVAFVTTFTYVGCGGGGGGNSGSSTPPASPTVTTKPASSITQDSATLNCTVNPNGLNINVYFQYGLTTSYSTTTTFQPKSGTNDIDIELLEVI